MRRRRTPLAASVLLAALVASAAPGTPATAAAAPALKGLVTLSGSTTGYVTVRLPKPAELVNPSLEGAPTLVTGTGRYAGFVLSDAKPQGIRILGGRQDGSRLGQYAIAIQGLPGDGRFPLPAGEYRLYLLADDAPVTVTLRFTGLAGAVALRPSTAVPYALESPEELITPGGTLAVGGAEGTLEGDGLAFDFLSDANAQFLASNTTLCFYEATPPPQPVGYGPGCPGGSPSPLTTISPGAGASEGAAFSGIADLPAGRYGLGFNRVGAGITNSLSYTAGFLTFDAEETATTGPPPGRTDGVRAPSGPGRAPQRAPALPASGAPDGLALLAVVTSAALAAVVRARRRAVTRA